MKKIVSLLIVSVLLLAPLAALAEGGAKAPSADDIELIHEVNIEGFRPPVIGSTPEYSYTLHVDEEMPYFIVYQYWHDNTTGADMFVEQEPFLADHMYSIGCILAARDNYEFAEDCVFAFNGDPNLFDPEFFHEYYLWDNTYVVQTVAVAPVSGETLPGDVNGDGSVTPDDALMALRAAMGLVSLDEAQTAAADMDLDGNVTLTDALLILRRAMGLN